MDVHVTAKAVADCNIPPATPLTKPVQSTDTDNLNTPALTVDTTNATNLCSPPPEPATPTAQYPPFSYTNHNTKEGSAVQLHYCTDLESFTTAIELLKGEKYLGIDVEHQPFGRPKKGEEPLPQSEEAKQFEANATKIALQTFEAYKAANPEVEVKLIHGKPAIPSGFRLGADRNAYARFTRYAKTKLSVFQIASSSHIIVAQLAALPHADEILDANEFIPPTLKTILADPTVLKMGVGVAGEQSDTSNCSRYFEMPSNGLLELNHLDAILTGRNKDTNPKPSLKALAEKWLKHTLVGKGYGSTTTSEWQVPGLSMEQFEYAANDAFVLVKIYEAMMQQYNAMTSKPAFPVLFSEITFEYTAWLSKRITELKERGTKSAKRTLCALGVNGEPSIPLNVPEGGSKAYAQSRKRRAGMLPEDAAMAEALSEVRVKLMQTYDIAVKRWILDDRAIDKIAAARPRPKHEDDFKGFVSAGVWKNMEPHTDVFLDAMVNQEILSNLL